MTKKKTTPKPAAQAEELREGELEQVAGGWELQQARITSYSVNGSGLDGGTTGGGPHVKVFDGSTGG